ncbi:hypothetical protein K504DRAFT_529064 [Pleomassaria siparia CBS 279.74]|uniref:Uncharacterized protein n=1 Tax=Pleomassaria siparia CBS 279.74 TaxID=1314801 RepID=A0A6G1KPN4_9PLEO|nr:hypothetical protein K504DRAFT_529064 [Pleomassaria siparia CBS 279.74]
MTSTHARTHRALISWYSRQRTRIQNSSTCSLSFFPFSASFLLSFSVISYHFISFHIISYHFIPPPPSSHTTAATMASPHQRPAKATITINEPPASNSAFYGNVALLVMLAGTHLLNDHRHHPSRARTEWRRKNAEKDFRDRKREEEEWARFVGQGEYRAQEIPRCDDVELGRGSIMSYGETWAPPLPPHHHLKTPVRVANARQSEVIPNDRLQLMNGPAPPRTLAHAQQPKSRPRNDRQSPHRNPSFQPTMPSIHHHAQGAACGASCRIQGLNAGQMKDVWSKMRAVRIVNAGKYATGENVREGKGKGRKREKHVRWGMVTVYEYPRGLDLVEGEDVALNERAYEGRKKDIRVIG